MCIDINNNNNKIGRKKKGNKKLIKHNYIYIINRNFLDFIQIFKTNLNISAIQKMFRFKINKKQTNQVVILSNISSAKPS